MTDTKYIVGAGMGGGGCFAGDTLVSVPGGTQQIDKIQVGDNVCSFDDKGEIYASKVLKVHKHENEDVVRYKLWGGKFVDATPNHWVLNQFNAFVGIGTLGNDDCVVDEFGHLRPIVERAELGAHTVYNLTVEGQHTFIANGVRVHNAGLGPQIAGAGGGGGSSSKGGGGKSKPPKEADDTLASVQFANVLDLISEGEIEGLDDGNKSIFLEGTPVENPNGSDNFDGFTIVTRTGTQSQSYISGQLKRTESEKSVNVEVTKAASVTRTITDTDVDEVRVTVVVPQLQKIEDDGDIVGTSVTLKIKVQYNGAALTL